MYTPSFKIANFAQVGVAVKLNVSQVYRSNPQLLRGKSRMTMNVLNLAMSFCRIDTG